MGVVTVGDNITDCYIDLGRVYPGGNSVNVAVAVARAGGSASYVGSVGNDAGGDLLRGSLDVEGVDIAGVRVEDGNTALAVVSHRDGDRVFGGLDRGVALFAPSSDDLEVIAANAIVHTTYCSGLESMVPWFADRARVSYDFDAHLDDGYADDLLEYVWLASFSAAHLDEDACHKLVRWAHQRGARHVLATRGAAGAVFSDGSDVIDRPADPASVVDTLGAGDACIGRLLFELESGQPAKEALRAAVRAASVACTYWGGYGHGAELTEDVRERARTLLAQHSPNTTDASQEEA